MGGFFVVVSIDITSRAGKDCAGIALPRRAKDMTGIALASVWHWHGIQVRLGHNSLGLKP